MQHDIILSRHALLQHRVGSSAGVEQLWESWVNSYSNNPWLFSSAKNAAKHCPLLQSPSNTAFNFKLKSKVMQELNLSHVNFQTVFTMGS